MDLFKVKSIAMLAVCAFMLLVGLYMIYEGMIHEVGTEAESHAEVSILHLGSITGQARIVIIAFGILLVFSSAKFLWKIDIGKTLSKKKGLKYFRNQVTETGRAIARRIRIKSLK